MNIHINYIDETADRLLNAKVLWVPSEQVVVRHLVKPSAPKRKWSSVIPWLLEDQLLEAVENMHFVFVENEGAKDLEVLAVSKQDIKSWLVLANNAGMSDFVILPDFLALPWSKGNISVAARGDVLLVRYGCFSGFALPKHLAWVLIAELLEKSESEIALHVAAPMDEIPSEMMGNIVFFDWIEDWNSSNSSQVFLDDEVINQANLLSGEFLQAKSRKSLYKPLAILGGAIALVLGAFLTIGFSNNNLLNQIEDMENQKSVLFSELFSSLRYNRKDSHNNIEGLLEKRLKQRESLQMPVMNVLVRLDQILSNCECSVVSVELSEQGGKLSLRNAVFSQLNLDIPDYEISVIPDEQNDELSLVIERRER